MSSAEARAAELVVRYNALIESLRAAHRMLRRGIVSRGIQMFEEELDGVLSDVGESGESEASEADETVPVQDISLEDVQAALLAQIPQPPAAPVRAFSGRCFRLDGSAVETAPHDAASETGSEDSQVPHCRRCGDRENLHVMDQFGPLLDAASEAERTYCSDCLYG